MSRLWPSVRPWLRQRCLYCFSVVEAMCVVAMASCVVSMTSFLLFRGHGRVLLVPDVSGIAETDGCIASSAKTVLSHICTTVIHPAAVTQPHFWRILSVGMIT